MVVRIGVGATSPGQSLAAAVRLAAFNFAAAWEWHQVRDLLTGGAAASTGAAMDVADEQLSSAGLREGKAPLSEGPGSDAEGGASYMTCPDLGVGGQGGGQPHEVGVCSRAQSRWWDLGVAGIA